MPTLKSGDIFERLQEHDLAIVFGHIGLNLMKLSWDRFKRTQRTLEHISDPFSEIPNKPHRVSNGQWLWFIPEGRNHGMTDDQLRYSLDTALSWARKEGHFSVVTNGISDTNHGTDSEANRLSDDHRVRFMVDYAKQQEASADDNLTIELVSLNDAFERNEDMI